MQEDERGVLEVLIFGEIEETVGTWLREIIQRLEKGQTATHAKQAEALRTWNPSELPKWLDEDFYRREILPKLSALTVKTIRMAIAVSHPYATLIKRGDRIPHPRHWLPLAQLTVFQLKSDVSGLPNMRR